MYQSKFHLQAELDRLYSARPRQLAFQATSMEEFTLWKRSLRAKLAEILGIASPQLPETPAVEHIHSIDKGEYIEEKYALDVGDFTPAPLYVLVPKSKPPYKTILAFHGHGAGVQPILGNVPPEHPQSKENFAQALAQAGYLVIAVEQRGFGERISDLADTSSSPYSCRQLSFDYLMQGRTMIGERCWDGMMAISYLRSRDDVVPDVVGCVGFSGGGTTALWLSALDDRVSAVVVASYFCSFKQSILGVWHCECNYVPHILEYAEIGDLAALIAPRPFRAVTGEHDPIFPLEGVRQEFETVKKAYRLLGVEERCSLTVHDGAHAYHHPMSQDWFTRWL